MYDRTVGRWLNKDPIGFEGGDTNTSRYVRNSPTNGTDPAGLSSYDQQLLDYYHRVLQQIMLVADALWRGGPAQLRKELPWYDITNAAKDVNGVFVRSGNSKIYFPKEWPGLQRAIAYVMQYYTKIGALEVDLTWLDMSSHNWGWFPGITLNRKNFYFSEEMALRELIHEPMHDIGWRWYTLGIGHGHIDPIVSVPAGNDIFTRLLAFLRNARLANGKSLWKAMLGAAGPQPKAPGK